MAIEIRIEAGKDERTSSVSASGSVQNIITDREMETFKIDDFQLKSAIDKYFGKEPNDAFLHSPTPWGDLYKRYGWEQVQTVLNVKSATITGITSEPTTIARKEFQNDSSKEVTFTAKITDSITDTTTSNWSQTNSIQVGQKFTYKVSVLGEGGGGETSFSYTGSWGKGGSHSQSVTVGTETGVSVPVGPHQSATAELTASRGTMKVRIVYEASLRGFSAVNYNPRYKGHHFYALGIASILGAAGVTNQLEFTQDIEIGFVSNARVIVKDADGKNIGEFSAGDLPGEIEENQYERLAKARAA